MADRHQLKIYLPPYYVHGQFLSIHCCRHLSTLDLIQNTTIEERVAVLEIQVLVIQDDLTGIEDDVTGLGVDLTELEGDVNFLFDEQVIQDERLLNLEQTTIEILGDVDSEYSVTKLNFAN